MMSQKTNKSPQKKKRPPKQKAAKTEKEKEKKLKQPKLTKKIILVPEENSNISPHDKHFREHFENIDVAKAFFQDEFPPELARETDWSTLRLAPRDFAHYALQNRKTDILYEVKVAGKKAYFYIHLEHQRDEDHWMAFRMIIYVIHVWEQYRKQHPETKELPFVFPWVVSQGEKKWEAPLSLHELLNVPEFLKLYVPDLTYKLTDLREVPDEELRQKALYGAAMLLMKHIDSPDLLQVLSNQIFPLLSELFDHPSGLDLIKSILYYLGNAGKNVDKEEVIQEFQKIPLPQKIKEATMTLAEQWREEGREEGEIKLTSKLLKMKFKKKAETWITKLTEYTEESMETIAERILFENQIEKIFQGLEKKKNPEGGI